MESSDASSPSIDSQLDKMDHFIHFISILVFIVAFFSHLAQANSAPLAADEKILRNLMATMVSDIKAATGRSATDLSSAFTTVLKNTGFRSTGSQTTPPTLEQIFAALPRPFIPEGPLINNTLQAAVDAAVINLAGSAFSLASGICNAASTAISINSGQIALAVAEWNVLSAAANSEIQSLQFDQVLYGDINSFLTKSDPLSSAISSLDSWEAMKEQVKTSITGQISQLKTASQILKSISPTS